jgi:hypothetical protein
VKSLPWVWGIWLLALSTGLGAAPSPHIPAAFSADFVQTHRLPGFRTPLVSHGVLRFDPVRGFRWEITAPYHYLFEMNGAHAQEQLPDGTLRKLDPEQTPWLAAVERIFVAALSGNESKLQQYFDVSVQPLAHGRRILLTPKPGPLAQAIARIRVLESAPGRPQQLDIREASGGSMQIRFTPLPSSAVTP